METTFWIILVVMLALGGLTAVALVGKNRAPISPGTAAMTVLIQFGLAAGVIYFSFIAH